MDFLDMVDRVLLLHNGSIDSLIICSDGETTTSQCQIDALVSTAIERNVQVLCLSYLSGVRLPQFCFKCGTLVELTLLDCTISFEPGAVCLPRLKKLHLERNWYRDDESLPNLVCGCLAIEDLVIHREFFDGMVCCYVRSPTLKSLLLLFDLSCDMSDHDHRHKLVLDIPAVQYLKIHDNISQIILTEKLSSLAVAEISFSSTFHNEENIGGWKKDMFQFVEKFSNAKSLTFRSPDSMEVKDELKC